MKRTARPPWSPRAFLAPPALALAASVAAVTACVDRDAGTTASVEAPVEIAPLPGDLPDPAAVADLYAHALHVAERARRALPELARTAFGVGDVHRRFGFDEQAIAAYRAGLKVHDREPAVYRHLAAILSRRGEVDEAEAACRTWLALEPEAPGARTRLGLIHALRGRFADAVTEYRAEIESSAADADTHYLLGQALFQRGAYAEAVASFRRSIELDPESARCWYGVFRAAKGLGRDADAASALARFRELKALARKREGAAGADARSGRDEKLRAVVKTYIDAAASYRLGRMDEEELYCLRAGARFVKDDAQLELALAERLWRDGDLEAAVAHAERAAGSAAEELDALRLLVRLHDARNRPRERADALRRILRRTENDADAHRELAILILRSEPLGEDSLRRGLDHARRAAEIGRSAANLEAFAYAHFSAGNAHEGIALLEEAVRLDPENEGLRHRLRVARGEAGDK